jgi:hypothetical protein
MATLVGEAGEKPTLEHELSLDQLSTRPRVLPVDETGRALKIEEGDIRKGIQIALYDGSGAEKLGLREDEFGLLDVRDPRKLAGLRTVPTDREHEIALELGPFESVRVFGRRVVHLYRRVEEWLAGTSLSIKRHDSSVNEEPYGLYWIPLLQINRGDGKQVARLVPIGASIIAAEGRVDLEGSVDTQPLVYFAAGGPEIGVTAGRGCGKTHAIVMTHAIFKGVSSEGWYWLDNVRLRRARPLDKSLFIDLLKGVADLYEL